GKSEDQLLTEISHDQQGREIARQHGNGLLSEKSYDPQGRLQQHTLTKTQSAQLGAEAPVIDPTQGVKPSVIQSKQYHYNTAGQISQIDDSQRGTKQYFYDALDRLTQVNGPQPEHFIHDPAHNILAAGHSEQDAQQQASNTQVKGNRLTFRGDTHYWYDQHGNRTASMRGKEQKLQTRYYYNSRHQLTKVEKGKNGQKESEVTFQYDPLGRRIGKTTADKHVEFLWDGDVLLRETNHPNQPGKMLHERLYFFEPGTFKPVALSDEGKVYHYHTDHLGTPDTLTDKKGNIAWSVSYQTYGNLAIKHEGEQFHQPIRFQGQYHDEETNLHYNRFRYYDPAIGQFITQDLIGLHGGINNYRYAPNPIKWIDPFGLTAKPGDCPDSDKPTHTPDGEEILYFKKEDIKVKKMYGGAEYEFYIDGPDDMLELAYTTVDSDAGSLEFYINNRFNRGIVLKGDGFGLTSEILSQSIDIYTKEHGMPPNSLDGSIIRKNLQNFQKEFNKIRNSSKKGTPESQMHVDAIKEISFGRERVKLGYDDIEVKAWGNEDVNIDGKKVRNVPTKVKITAKKSDSKNSDD
ncbi:RHS repeat domain-containing protein, partial [Marinibactrum halimedae]